MPGAALATGFSRLLTLVLSLYLLRFRYWMLTFF
jgi:Na+-driven multidrug efflux pump